MVKTKSNIIFTTLSYKIHISIYLVNTFIDLKKLFKFVENHLIHKDTANELIYFLEKFLKKPVFPDFTQ